MSKLIPCFICRKLVEVQDDKAIAKLCPDHNTQENREIMGKTPISKLLEILNAPAEVEKAEPDVKEEPKQPETKTIGKVRINRYGEVF